MSRGGRKLRAATGALAILLATGCYHAVVETGRPQSGTVVEDQWADAFLYGLVPPKPVETAQRCQSGVARVETRLSFLNLLADLITFGIYTPMHIKVYCAAAGGEDAATERTVHVPANSSEAEVESALSEAVLLSARTGQAAWLVVDHE